MNIKLYASSQVTNSGGSSKRNKLEAKVECFTIEGIYRLKIIFCNIEIVRQQEK